MNSQTDNSSKEQAILDSARFEFIEYGYVGAKTVRIAARAGVTHALLHYYFRTKENLFNTIFDKELTRLKESLFESFNNDERPFLDKVQKSVEDHFDFVRKYPRMPRFVINELISDANRLANFQTKISIVVSDIIEKIGKEIEIEVKKGTINPIHPITLVVDIASLNLFVFTVLPLIKSFAIEPYGNEEAFIEARKKENVEIIMRRLRK